MTLAQEGFIDVRRKVIQIISVYQSGDEPAGIVALLADGTMWDVNTFVQRQPQPVGTQGRLLQNGEEYLTYSNKSFVDDVYEYKREAIWKEIPTFLSPMERKFSFPLESTFSPPKNSLFKPTEKQS